MLIEQGLKLFSELKLKEAREKLTEALELSPENKLILVHLFNIDKISAKSENFHHTAKLLLASLASDENATDELIKIFEEYRRLTDKPRIDLNITFSLFFAYVSQKHLSEAYKLINVLLKKAPKHDKIPEGLMALAKACRDAGKTQDCKKCLTLLSSKYSTTPFGQKAAETLATPP